MPIIAPVRVLLMTSLRDVAAQDKNGSFVESRCGRRYMMGIPEYAVLQCGPGGKLHDLMEVVGIVIDDLATERSLQASSYRRLPQSNRPWIHPLGLTTHHGASLVNLTHWIPSDFRSLPRDDVAGRRRSKEAFETRVWRLAQSLQANVIVSDHYMCRIEHLHRWMPQSVLNIHPAITIRGHEFCFRGKTPTADALARARSGKPTMTGATLHYVNDIIDDGPPIACSTQTPVHAEDTPEALRYRNYQVAKLPVFACGMRQYIFQQYPQLRAAA